MIVKKFGLQVVIALTLFSETSMASLAIDGNQLEKKKSSEDSNRFSNKRKRGESESQSDLAPPLKKQKLFHELPKKLVEKLKTEYKSDAKKLDEKVAEKFIRDLANDAFEVVDIPNIDSENVKKGFDLLLKSRFWLEKIAKFTIGSNFRNLSKEEREKVVNDYLPRDLYKQFLSKFSEYKTSKFNVTRSRKKSNSQVEVESVLNAKKAMKIVWTVCLTEEGGVKVYDATYEGISGRKTLKSVYSDRMKRKEKEEKSLLEKLWGV